MISNRLIRISLVATLTLGAFSQSFAQFLRTREYHIANPNAAAGGTLWIAAQYIDFSSTSTNPGRTWATLPLNTPPFNGGEKYFKFMLPSVPGGGNMCYEISTAKGMLGADGPQDAETVNADTKLYFTYNTQTVANTLLNDDFAGTLYSKVRVWAIAGPTLNFSVAAYSTATNNIDFYLIIKSLKFTNPDACKLANVSFFSL